MEVYRPPHGKDPFCMNPGWIFKVRQWNMFPDDGRREPLFRSGEIVMLVTIVGLGAWDSEKKSSDWKYKLTFLSADKQKCIKGIDGRSLADRFELIWPYGHII